MLIALYERQLGGSVHMAESPKPRRPIRSSTTQALYMALPRKLKATSFFNTFTGSKFALLMLAVFEADEEFPVERETSESVKGNIGLGLASPKFQRQRMESMPGPGASPVQNYSPLRLTRTTSIGKAREKQQQQ